jgi:hypothetical protein
MRRCGHALLAKEPWDNIIGITVTFANGAKKLCPAIVCWKCGHQLSLGESNDDPSEVQQEIAFAHDVLVLKPYDVDWFADLYTRAATHPEEP